MGRLSTSSLRATTRSISTFTGRTAANLKLAGLEDLPIFTPAGGVVPLGAAATITETVDTNAIRRINGRRTVTLNVIPPESIALEAGVELMRRGRD